MASNTQDSVVVQVPNVTHLVATETPTGVGVVETQEAAARPGPLTELRANLRDAFRSWSVGRRLWDQAQAWIVARRSVLGTSSRARPTQQD